MSNDGVSLQTSGEYAAVRGGLATYVRLLEVRERCKELHPSMSSDDINLLREQIHEMPIRLTKKELPYEISGYYANIALTGLERARRFGSPEAREYRESQRQALAALLGQV